MTTLLNRNGLTVLYPPGYHAERFLNLPQGAEGASGVHYRVWAAFDSRSKGAILPRILGVGREPLRGNRLCRKPRGGGGWQETLPALTDASLTEERRQGHAQEE